MLVGTNEWRAEIAGYQILTVSKVSYTIPVFKIFSCIPTYFAYLYFFILMSVIMLPFSLLISFTWSNISVIMPCIIFCPVTKSPDIMYILVKLNSHATLELCFMILLLSELVKCSRHIILHKNLYTKNISMVL